MLQEIKKKLKADQKILAVSKLQSTEKIRKLYSEGQVDFGENYVQEALEKIESLKDLKISWHLIGPLQTNKIKFLKNHFEYIHSIDSFKIAQAISDHAQKINYIQKVFLQVNISQESTKAGFSVEDLATEYPQIKQLPHVKVVGLMTMPPLQNQASQNRPLFKKLKELNEKYHLSELSMGTSHDYEVALDEGSTWVRLGTILFGERTK